MEIRKESISALKICRFCLTQDETLTSLYESNRAPKNSVTLPLKILSSVSIEVFPSDKMPSFICKQCKFFMELSYEYKQICRLADENILQYIQNATPLTSVLWPTSLQNMFHGNSKSSQVGDMKVVDGGSTIQVTTQESDSDDDDDGNTYDIKIGEVSDDGSKNAHVKVIASPKKQARKPKGKEWVDEDSEPGAGAGGARVAAGCWACDECERTYPLQQLLELHKRQKHRTRSVQCDKCNAKFFTNYDLGTHQLRHSEELSFQCVACDKKFKRLIRLKRHEKIVHADIPQLPCPHCPATFLSLEELEAHQKRHVHNAGRRYVCPICDKRFFEKGTLQRHKENMHDRSPEFSCEYCPQQFTTVSKLTRHVRAHAGERAYPCKYCDKSFLKSHHYTRHLRIKHGKIIRSCRGPFGEHDQFRCEQCEDAFATQDELIYHSAIHATQNLTCPLCQEKFDDVDAVTAHIKSHVNGMEFMCDLCELVFTSQEKLHSHIAVAHEDEIRNSEDPGHDESSMEMDAEEDEDDNAINLKEVDGHMVVEIKKPGEFMITDSPQGGDVEEKNDNTNSEESETEATFAELSTVDTLAMARTETDKSAPAQVTARAKTLLDKSNEKNISQTARIVRKAEEIKRHVEKQQTPEPSSDKKEKSNNKSEGGNTAGASDKSLRLLEKELQELKRTNTRNEAVKTPSKPVEMARNRRPQLHTSTPKTRGPEEKKVQLSTKSPAPEKKVLERRVVTKENKEAKETKETRGNNTSKEEKEVNEKETPKSVVKNGTGDKSGSEEGIRRSTRPSKIKNYAKMIQNRAQNSEEEEDSDESEEYKEEKNVEGKQKQRRGSVKPVLKAAATTTPANRKRGRPRKDTSVPSKVKRGDNEDDEARTGNTESDSESKTQETTSTDSDQKNNTPVRAKSDINTKPTEQNVSSGGILVSPTGQTLKKIPIQALPPGVKPLPLPVNARPVGSGEVCEMQIGKKMVKVQKIVMTKAEVEAMAKQGLVEMKDGTMVLKQGIKLPTGLKNSPVRVGEELTKESPTKSTPTRCELGDA